MFVLNYHHIVYYMKHYEAAIEHCTVEVYLECANIKKYLGTRFLGHWYMKRLENVLI